MISISAANRWARIKTTNPIMACRSQLVSRIALDNPQIGPLPHS